MNTRILGAFLIAAVLAATPALAQQPGPELVQAGVTAYNNQDLGYFEQRLAEDVVWLDEDGHVLTGKSTVLGFIRRQLNATPAPTLSVSNVRVDSAGDAAWATFAYTITGGESEISGLNTTVFEQVDGEWRIALVHGAVNAESHH